MMRGAVTAPAHNASAVPKSLANHFNDLHPKTSQPERRPPAEGWRPPPHRARQRIEKTIWRAVSVALPDPGFHGECPRPAVVSFRRKAQKRPGSCFSPASARDIGGYNPALSRTRRSGPAPQRHAQRHHRRRVRPGGALRRQKPATGEHLPKASDGRASAPRRRILRSPFFGRTPKPALEGKTAGRSSRTALEA